MLPPKTRWSVETPDPSLVRELSERLQIRPLLAALLAARGYRAEEAEFFLYGSPEFHDPYALDGMTEAVDRIRSALQHRRKILVYGDYDADGVSGTSLLVRLFRMLHADFDYTIPHRVNDGYGLHTQALEKAKREGVSLVVTVDTGITAVEEAAAAKSLGLDLIITDHHEPPEVLPDAAAVVNPKKPSCGYPFKGLSGVGVAFKLAQALLGRVPEELTPWAALGTIADVMPLTGENRSIVKMGIERLRTAPPAGFAALLSVAGIQPRDVGANTIGFGLAPRINASGRLESADDAVRLLITDDEREAGEIAWRLDALNKERQRLVEETAAEARVMVEAAGGPGDAIVVANDHWNPGVIGIAASRLVEMYHVPTVVIAMDKESGIGKGSARTISGFHLYQALKACDSALLRFGGHESAAGLSVEAGQLERFAALFRQHAAETITPEMKVPALEADLEVSMSDLSVENIEELEKLAPYGPAHPIPRFVLRNAEIRGVSVIGKDRRHAKFRLANGPRDLEALGFGMADRAHRLTQGSQLSMIGELSVNEWNGLRTPQIIVRDIAVPHVQLFDWRDAAGSGALKRRWEQAGVTEGSPAFLLGAYDELPPELAAWWADVPFYRMAEDGEGNPIPSPVNAIAAETSFERMTDLFIISCPFPYPRFHLILKQGLSLERLYVIEAGPHSLAAGEPAADRAALKLLYGALRELEEAPERDIVRLLAERTGMNAATVRFALKVFAELEFVVPSARVGHLCIAPSPKKRELTDSPAYREEQLAAQARREWAEGSAQTLRQRILTHMDGSPSEAFTQKTEAMA